MSAISSAPLGQLRTVSANSQITRKQTLFDHLIGTQQDRLGNRDAKCLGDSSIDREQELRWLL